MNTTLRKLHLGNTDGIDVATFRVVVASLKVQIAVVVGTKPLLDQVAKFITEVVVEKDSAGFGLLSKALQVSFDMIASFRHSGINTCLHIL